MSSTTPILLVAASMVACLPASNPPVEDAGLDAGLLGACPSGLVSQVSVPSRKHVPIGTVVTYDSNPPAGGDHYPVWATWGVHIDVVPSEYFVHNEEHGGVVLFYDCDAGCPLVVAALRQVLNAQPTDPSCPGPGPDGSGVDARMVLTPDPALDVAVAAAAWGWTYKVPLTDAGPCVDVASLQAFISAHYGQGPESDCAQGLY